ncbi:hypothetical protein D7Z26_03235 [Cohnella endophytica]|uniref:Uncharacterized protein n=1 Tax=Cohnella endophytica TaxID=2419778 RepID=A0A494Y673_9BACL|nr:hypothetical protein [Cohnella endophytica]RKP57015.1 hypothetical protein D7Z26_03235 [Cohnella endophytica]
MKKIKILPITITAALTAAILFGGWFAYRHYGVEQPLDRVANAVPGVQSAKVIMSTGSVKVDVKLAPDANLGDVYRQIKQNGAGEIGSKDLELAPTASGNARLDKAWSYALFDVAESMENHKYSGVRDAMDSLSKQFPGVTATTDMDDNNVYISMRDGNAAKFIVLPRQPATLGAWPNA